MLQVGAGTIAPGTVRFQIGRARAEAIRMELSGDSSVNSQVVDRDPPSGPCLPMPSDRSSQRLALGLALRRREKDILRLLQEAYLRSSGTTHEEVTASPLWEILTIAVSAIVDWLTDGRVAGEDDKSRIASLGTSVASVQVATGTSDPPAEGPSASPPHPADNNRALDMLSVTLLTKLNLWWSEQTCAVLTEEAARLGISRPILDEATEMVVRSCNSSLVRMAKQYDAELATLHQELSRLALHDSLTGIANRKVFLDRLDRALARLARHVGGLAVVFIDLDDFKSVNDTYGHAVGDAVLVEMARRMTDLGRPEDLFARMSGDEFVALIEDLPNPLADVRVLAERLRCTLFEPIFVHGEALEVTVSIGVAAVNESGCQAEEVLARADSALYAAKRGGATVSPPSRSAGTWWIPSP